MISNVLGLVNDMLSLKTDVKVPSVRHKQNKLREILIFCWHLESHWQAGSVVQCTPRIRIKMSRIWNTGCPFVSSEFCIPLLVKVKIQTNN